jgi:hypothetical protein
MWKKLALGAVLICVGKMAAAEVKVDVCHRPPGNPANVRVISIWERDVADHLAHGDHLAFDDYCYVVVPGDQDAASSEQACQDLYAGHLASIHSQDEDNFLSRLVDPNATGGLTARIGGVAATGFCSGPFATYAWTDGTPWDFSNWRTNTGEPNCTPDGAPASVQFWPNTNGGLTGWNDTPSEDSLGSFVCKY